MKDKDTRQSKGVAFVLFLDRESAHNCARAVNNKQVGLFHIKTTRLLMLYVTRLLVADVSLLDIHLSELQMCLSPSCLAER